MTLLAGNQGGGIVFSHKMGLLEFGLIISF